jgi:hypothetical protein
VASTAALTRQNDKLTGSEGKTKRTKMTKLRYLQQHTLKTDCKIRKSLFANKQ